MGLRFLRKYISELIGQKLRHDCSGKQKSISSLEYCKGLYKEKIKCKQYKYKDIEHSRRI
jgi:hypothetical protein